MKCRVINQENQRTWIIVFETGEEALEGLKGFALEKGLAASQFTGVGAFQEVELGFFEIEKQTYKRIRIAEQVEVLSFLGDITEGDKQPKVHAHVVLGKQDGTAWGGHLMKGTVRPTLEIMLTESPVHLKRSFNQTAGLALIDPELK
jgi:predicted DNA-binding protein with PD1-like motif